jgi:hypothetical protein
MGCLYRAARWAVRPDMLYAEPRAPSNFVVRRDAAVRLSRCRALELCRVLKLWVVSCTSTVRRHTSNSLCRVPLVHPHGKEPARHTSKLARNIGCRHVAPLSCVCARQSDQMSFDVCIRTHGKDPDVFPVIFIF